MTVALSCAYDEHVIEPPYIFPQYSEGAFPFKFSEFSELTTMGEEETQIDRLKLDSADLLKACQVISLSHGVTPDVT